MKSMSYKTLTILCKLNMTMHRCELMHINKIVALLTMLVCIYIVQLA